MSRSLISRSPDLTRLVQEGYPVEIRHTYLLVKDVPELACGEPGGLPGISPLVAEARLEDVHARFGKCAPVAFRRAKDPAGIRLCGFGEIPDRFEPRNRGRHTARPGRFAGESFEVGSQRSSSAISFEKGGAFIPKWATYAGIMIDLGGRRSC